MPRNSTKDVIEGFSFVCKHCQALFEDMRSLRLHKSTLHKFRTKEVTTVFSSIKSETEFDVSLPGGSTDTERIASSHHNTKSEIWYRCQVCLLSFSDESKFFIHKEIHELEKTDEIFHTGDGNVYSLQSLPPDNVEAFIPKIALTPIEDDLYKSLSPPSSLPIQPKDVGSDEPEPRVEDKPIGRTLRKRKVNAAKYVDSTSEEQSSSEDQLSDSASLLDAEDSITKTAKKGITVTKKVRKKKNIRMRPFCCKICRPRGMKFYTKGELVEHAKIRHWVHNSFQCPVCSFTTPLLPSLQSHMDTHPNPKNVCYICDPRTAWDDRKVFHKHISSHNNSNSKYKCPHCPYIARELRSINPHLRRHAVAKETSGNSRTEAEEKFGLDLVCWYCFISKHPSYKYTDLNLYSAHLKTHLNSEHLFSCPMCPHILQKRAGRINQHFKERHPEIVSKVEVSKRRREYLCRICTPALKLPHQVSYVGHMKSFHLNSAGEYQCPHCSAFTSKGIRRLTEHMKNYHTLQEQKYFTTGLNGKHKCLLCFPAKIYYHDTNYDHHMITIHRKRNIYKCPICLSNESSIEGIEVHMQTHSALIPKYYCFFCSPPAPWFDRTLYYTHVREHHLDSSGKYMCPLCSKYSCGNIVQCAGHIKKHLAKDTSSTWIHSIIDAVREKWRSQIPREPITSEGERSTTRTQQECLPKFACKFCPNVSGVYEKALQHHVQAVHSTEFEKLSNTDEITLLCITCGFIANSSGDLQTHMDSTHNHFFCHICGLRMKKKRLDKHMKSFHSNTKCSKCDQNFNSWIELRGHKARVHWKKREYVTGSKICDLSEPTSLKCSLCSNRFSTFRRLQKHKISKCKFIEKKTRSVCNICGKNFISTYTLKRHVEFVHRWIWSAKPDSPSPKQEVKSEDINAIKIEELIVPN